MRRGFSPATAASEWEEWSPAPVWGRTLEDLRAVGAPLTFPDDPSVAPGALLTRRWCRAAMGAFQAFGSYTTPADPAIRGAGRRFTARLVADADLLEAWLAVLTLGDWSAACAFAEARAAEGA